MRCSHGLENDARHLTSPATHCTTLLAFSLHRIIKTPVVVCQGPCVLPHDIPCVLLFKVPLVTYFYQYDGVIVGSPPIVARDTTTNNRCSLAAIKTSLAIILSLTPSSPGTCARVDCWHRIICPRHICHGGRRLDLKNHHASARVE